MFRSTRGNLVFPVVSNAFPHQSDWSIRLDMQKGPTVHLGLPSYCGLGNYRFLVAISQRPRVRSTGGRGIVINGTLPEVLLWLFRNVVQRILPVAAVDIVSLICRVFAR